VSLVLIRALQKERLYINWQKRLIEFSELFRLNACFKKGGLKPPFFIIFFLTLLTRWLKSDNFLY
jgi:hypothetical protein